MYNNSMNNINIQFIPHKDQRYDTFGDWYYAAGGHLHINVSSDQGHTDDEQFLVALHELIEVYLCKKRGISQEKVDQFDMNIFPEQVRLGLVEEDSEPGNCYAAPYVREHRFAMLIEHFVAHELGVTPYGNVT